MSDDPTRRDPVGEAKPGLGVFPERFEPGEEIGRGGMGRVVEARDKMLGRTVALKEALATDEDALRRFARETQITARLEHPSIVPVYDAGVSPEGSPFYVMRKVTGRPLSELIANARSLPERLALLPHVLAACQAVAHAHARGIIHRDLKPANILAGAHGETIVIDWGLAKATGETEEKPRAQEPIAADSLATRAGTVMGTPGFMSPEQHAGDDVDERADVYALGATLHYVLAGQLPPSELPGAPSELRAIVSKALANDIAARYRNAGALADDLARFTTGQLVAAHDYSTRERITRFVRRHKALVITIAAAMVVLAIAVARIIAARNEAVEQAAAAERARAAEAERASDLVISQARLLLATNPTGAAALVRPLAETPRWREVRAIVAGARAGGIARSLPGPETITYADLSDTGMRAVACGADGSVHVYDLEARTHVVVATVPGKVRAQLAGEARVVAWADNTFTIIDIATRATLTFAHPRPILEVDTTADAVYFVDEDRAAWRMRIPSGERVAIPLDGKAGKVAVSHNGKRIAFGGDRIWMIEATHPELVEKLYEGQGFDLTWSSESDHIAAVTGKAVLDITVHPELEIEEYRIANQSAALARGQLYTTGLAGFTVGDRAIASADLESSLAGLHVTRGDFVVGASPTSLVLFDGTRTFDVPLPAKVSVLLASPHGPYIFGICGGRPLVWNIEHVMPRRIEVPLYSQIVTVGRDHAWTITSRGGVRAIDLKTGALQELGALPPLRYVSALSGAFVLARPLSSEEALLVRPGQQPELLAQRSTYATVLDDRSVLVATAARELVLHDLQTKQHRTLATYDSAITRIITREDAPRWIVVVLEDGTVERRDLHGAATRSKVAPRTAQGSPGLAATAATSDGDVFLATGTRVIRWRADGTQTEHVLLPRAITALFLLADNRVVARTEDGLAYAIATAGPRLVRLPPVGHTITWGAADPTLLVTDDGTGGVTVIDLEVTASWKIARATPPSSTPDIAGDGTAVILRDATLDSTAVALWQLDLPTSAAATAAWIDEMTNATFDPRTGMLGWPR